MKISNKNIYIADLNKAIHYRGKDTDFELAKYDADLILKDCIVIKVAEETYVPLVYFNNLLSMLSIKFAMKLGKHDTDDRFISTRPNIETKELYFLTNINKLDFKEDKVSLKTLKSWQRKLDHENGMYTYLDVLNVKTIHE